MEFVNNCQMTVISLSWEMATLWWKRWSGTQDSKQILITAGSMFSAACMQCHVSAIGSLVIQCHG